MIKIDIIIPVRNPNHDFDNFISVVDSYTQSPKFDIKIIVIDNGTTNIDIYNICENYKSINYFLYEKKINPYSARNYGISKSDADIIVHLDEKCFPTADWLESAVNLIQNEEIEVVASNKVVILTDVTDPYQYVSVITVPIIEDSVRVGDAPGGSLFFKRVAFDKYGFFDDNTRSTADSLWFFNAIRKGLNIKYCKNSIVHYKAKSRIGVLSQALRIGRGNNYFHLKIGKSRRWMILSAIWNMRPPPIRFVKDELKKRTYKLNNIMLYSIYISYFKYNIYFQLGRLGVKKIFDIKSD